MIIKPNIFVVCYDDKDRGNLLSILEKYDYHIEQASNGVQAVNRLMSGLPCDVVLARVNHSRNIDKDFIEQVRSFRPGTPIVIISGKKRLNALLECRELGGDDYATMPINEKKLISAITNVIDISRKHSPPKLAEMDFAHGRRMADYELKSVLGSGGAGIVYLAEKLIDGRKQQYALKVLQAEERRNEEQVRDILERFLREAELASTIKHPRIVPIIDYGIAEEVMTPYIVMEFVKGRSLRHYIGVDDTLHFMQKVNIIRQISEALDEIHSHHVCHRDVKPENILLDFDLGVKVTDFGIARLPNSQLTQTLKVLGTPAYMSPESFYSARVDHRADIFSLGIVTYELFLERKPFMASSIAGIRHIIQNDYPLEPRKVQNGFPLEFQQIMEKMLKKEPCDRYQNVAQLIKDLDSFTESSKDAPETTIMKFDQIMLDTQHGDEFDKTVVIDEAGEDWA